MDPYRISRYCGVSKRCLHDASRTLYFSVALRSVPTDSCAMLCCRSHFASQAVSLGQCRLCCTPTSTSPLQGLRRLRMPCSCRFRWRRCSATLDLRECAGHCEIHQQNLRSWYGHDEMEGSCIKAVSCVRFRGFFSRRTCCSGAGSGASGHGVDSDAVIITARLPVTRSILGNSRDHSQSVRRCRRAGLRLESLRVEDCESVAVRVTVRQRARPCCSPGWP